MTYQMKTSLKFNSTFLKLNFSLGEIDVNIKMIWEFFWILGAGNLKSAVTLEISVAKLFFLDGISDEDFLYEIK